MSGWVPADSAEKHVETKLSGTIAVSMLTNATILIM
jgi:hypothetical protein